MIDSFFEANRTIGRMSFMVLMMPTAVVFLISWGFVDRLLVQESDILRGDHDEVNLCLQVNT